MKLPIFLIAALFGLFLTVASCSSKKEQPATEMNADSPDAGIVTQDPSASPTIQASGTEAHFKCPNNCEGGTGDAKGKCPVCGTEMVHNQAFHGAATPPDPGSSPESSIKVDPMNAQNTIINSSTTATPQTAQPPAAQNAKGEWHFSCAKCDGGAGAAGNCPKCGSPLAHNQAFHQQ